MRALHLVVGLCAATACMTSADDTSRRDSTHVPVVAAPRDSVALARAVVPTAAPDSTSVLAAADSNVVIDPAISEPRIDGEKGRHVLHLPPSMDSALHVLLPHFKATPRTAFEPSMAAWVWGRHPETSLFAVIADFDGDGRADVAIDATAGIVVVLNLPAGPRAECVERCTDTTDVPSPGSLQSYIEVEKRGKVGVFDEDDDHASITIARDGFQRVYFEKAAELFYLQRGKWIRIVTAD